jgi:hypothetical protein
MRAEHQCPGNGACPTPQLQLRDINPVPERFFISIPTTDHDHDIAFATQVSVVA